MNRTWRATDQDRHGGPDVRVQTVRLPPPIAPHHRSRRERLVLGLLEIPAGGCQAAGPPHVRGSLAAVHAARLCGWA